MKEVRHLRPVLARLLFMLVLCAAVSAAPGRPIYASTTPQGALFITKSTNTQSASTQVDASGGMYAAFDTDPQYQAVYAYCAPSADCSQPANWAQATFQNNVHRVQLALTPQGQPRMLLTINDFSHPTANGGDSYWYAECNTSCTNAANWTSIFIGAIVGIESNLFTASDHYFALDPQGRPRFVYGPLYGVNPITFQVYSWMNYATCDTGCMVTGAIDPNTGMPTPVNWSFGQINANFVQPALAFTSSGQPRVVGFTATNDGTGDNILQYWECNSACTTSANWSSTTVGQPGLQTSTVSLRVNSHDQLRMVLYYLGTQTSYLWCNGSCTTSSNWGSVAIGTFAPGGDDGSDPDLQLDKQDHPRIAYHSTESPGLGVGLGYAWCDSNCESSSAQFQRILADSSDQLNTDWPITPPPGCVGSWLAGYRPSLALDSSGNPRIASDGEYFASGCFGGGHLHSGMRYTYFNQGSTPGSHQVFVPWVRN